MALLIAAVGARCRQRSNRRRSNQQRANCHRTHGRHFLGPQKASYTLANWSNGGKDIDATSI
ncbi:hypothetical protein [Mycolicibacterium mucogenicum]|uniref:Uncharacterized protein n=1 Tax=Mycolicibacterium mucogenicum TaxID=56689 RepID=A0A4R5WCQ2_MYCMU|nr:hypothetical protein [Mycolicibacterium mucogenicum]TDK87463.1 hypothetical protein EUA03_18010 [Mycolicibacterium mucogenicum]